MWAKNLSIEVNTGGFMFLTARVGLEDKMIMN